MKIRIQFMYENGDTQMLDLILSSKSVGDFLNKAEYISEISSYDRKMLNKMKETKQEIAEQKTAEYLKTAVDSEGNRKQIEQNKNVISEEIRQWSIVLQTM